ncbi:threonylcarbamoyl-AMP synthase [Hypericibacter adhaerens]|uniref:Threonylcarbamoyl-AMP synthase n=1 Tax=Hypericibacter adhaerens TaxID=2602016 RepID=A0A5J6N1Z3_9PROT|nr:L-threonylcarbamoyladenylate synthase [Hypericibacter adhaerens]QEX23731.1 threonylcarbamoyl-AMP synthase [Hypericibacter adhaerens]
MNGPSPRILSPTDEAIAEAAALLEKGALVALPTETVYGLAGDATSDSAVAAIFAAKDRPQFNPLIAHYPSAEAAARDVSFDPRAQELARRFWPGPLTLVLPRRADCRVSLLASAGLDSQAVRVPRHEVAQRLLAKFGRPLAAPSANRSGRVSPTLPQHVAEELGHRVALILDGGACAIGIESSVVALLGNDAVLLRPGAVTEEEIQAAIGPLAHAGEAGQPRGPGMMASHYAPELPLRLDATSLRDNEALLAFGSQPLPGAALSFNLSAGGDLQEAAAHLFAALRQLDRDGRCQGLSGIAAMPVPDRGIGRAINDRLRRAAAPRPVS